MIKFEASPAESFISLPGDNYSSLFAPATPSSTTTINPLDVMTPQSPQSPSDDMQTPQLPTISEEDEASTPGPEDSPSSDKKQSKKRKSWGQVLPEPKTNLPPR